MNEFFDEQFNEEINEEIDESSNDIVVREISGKRSYKTGEVSKILGITPAMVGYYCRVFEEHLNLQHEPGQHRAFTDEHIKILEYIVYLLRNEKMTVEQAKEFLSTPQGRRLTPLNNEEDKVKSFVELVSSELKTSIEKIVKNQVEASLKSFMPNLVEVSMDKLSNTLLKQQEEMEGSIKELVNESVSSLVKVNSTIEESVESMCKATNQLTTVEQSLVNWREQKNKEHSPEKKGIFSKIFKK